MEVDLRCSMGILRNRASMNRVSQAAPEANSSTPIARALSHVHRRSQVARATRRATRQDARAPLPALGSRAPHLILGSGFRCILTMAILLQVPGSTPPRPSSISRCRYSLNM